jgi:transglutaminase-like putative cysteine protease
VLWGWLQGQGLALLVVATGMASAVSQAAGGPGAFLDDSPYLDHETFPDGAYPKACEGVEPLAGDIQHVWGWNYGNQPWCFRASYDAFLAASYRDRFHGATDRDFRGYVNDVGDDAAISAMAQQFQKAATSNGFSPTETVAFLTSFVQSMPYTSDSVTTGADEYVRYPYETLVDNGGDCEDTSILLAALLKELGFIVVLVEPPGHLGVGVALASAGGSAAFEYNGRPYAYVETTGAGWAMGDVPPQYEGDEVEVYDV